MAATINYFPFDDGSGANSTEVRWGEMMKHMRSTGVISASTTLSSTGDNAVAPDTMMQIQIYDGEVWMQGFYMQHTGDPYTLIIADNSSGDPRIDLVIVKLDNVGNTIGYAVLEGTPDPSPVPPTLTQTSDEWDLPLAEIAVANGETVIGAGDITDVRIRSMQGEGGSSPESPYCFVYRDATTTGLTDASTTTIDFDTARLNPDAMWENVTNPERITIGEDGVYLIHAIVGWVGVALANGPVEAEVVLNGTTTIARSRILIVGDDTLYLNADIFYELSATDYLTLDVTNNSGETLSLTSNADGPSLQAIKIIT